MTGIQTNRSDPKKPRNYKGWLTYVNLVTKRVAFFVDNFSYITDLHVIAAREGPHYLFDLTLILRVINKFGAYEHRWRSAVLMRCVASPFAVFKPTFRCQKDEN